MKKVPPQLLDFIETGNKFIIAGHKDEDGDCVGSQLALSSVLRRLGKEAIPCSSGSFKRTEIKQYEHLFCTTPDEEIRENTRLIITDCSSLERTGDLAKYLAGLPAAFIDHHKPDTDECDKAEAVYICEDSPSVTLMILHLADALGTEINREEAELIMLGFCTDTGFYRHLDSASAEAFEDVTRLVRAGASPKKIHDAIYGGKSLNSRYLLGNILGRTESHFNGKLLISHEEHHENKLYGSESRDSDVMYQLLQSIAGAEAVAVIRQEKPDYCSIGLRSRDQTDVAEIARILGGGGHKNAAGAGMEGTIPEIKNKILELFKAVF